MIDEKEELAPIADNNRVGGRKRSHAASPGEKNPAEHLSVKRHRNFMATGEREEESAPRRSDADDDRRMRALLWSLDNLAQGGMEYLEAAVQADDGSVLDRAMELLHRMEGGAELFASLLKQADEVGPNASIEEVAAHLAAIDLQSPHSPEDLKHDEPSSYQQIMQQMPTVSCRLDRESIVAPPHPKPREYVQIGRNVNSASEIVPGSTPPC